MKAEAADTAAFAATPPAADSWLSSQPAIDLRFSAMPKLSAEAATGHWESQAGSRGRCWLAAPRWHCRRQKPYATPPATPAIEMPLANGWLGWLSQDTPPLVIVWSPFAPPPPSGDEGQQNILIELPGYQVLPLYTVIFSSATVG